MMSVRSLEPAGAPTRSKVTNRRTAVSKVEPVEDSSVLPDLPGIPLTALAVRLRRSFARGDEWLERRYSAPWRLPSSVSWRCQVGATAFGDGGRDAPLRGR